MGTSDESVAHLQELLERIGHLLRAEERRAGGAAGLQPVQLHALAYLDRCNAYSDTPAGVTEYLGVTKGTASQTLKRLEEKGLVARRPDPADGRSVHLRPTAKGRRLLASVRPLPSLVRALAAPDAPGASALASSLTELLRGLQRANEARTFGVCRTCTHFRPGVGAAGTCGLTGDPLDADATTRICREHEPAAKR